MAIDDGSPIIGQNNLIDRIEAFTRPKRKNRPVPGRMAIDDGSPIIGQNNSIDRIEARNRWRKGIIDLKLEIFREK